MTEISWKAEYSLLYSQWWTHNRCSVFVKWKKEWIPGLEWISVRSPWHWMFKIGQFLKVHQSSISLWFVWVMNISGDVELWFELCWLTLILVKFTKENRKRGRKWPKYTINLQGLWIRDSSMWIFNWLLHFSEIIHLLCMYPWG